MDWSNVEKSSVNSIRENVISVVDTLGRAALHAMAPDNFEYYMCSLELLDSSKSTKGFMTFAVMPNNILENKTEIATINKTNRGIEQHLILVLFHEIFLFKEHSEES